MKKNNKKEKSTVIVLARVIARGIGGAGAGGTLRKQSKRYSFGLLHND